MFLGDHAEYTVETNGGSLFVLDRNPDRLIDAGTEVYLSFQASGVTVLPRSA
jgi:hypothetical protein